MTMKFKPIYSVAEVAKIMGLSRRQALRRLKKAGVVTETRRGEKIDVPVSKLRRLLKDAWDSAQMVAQVAR